MVYPLIGHLLDVAAVAWWAWDLHLVDVQRRVLVTGMGMDPDSAKDRGRARALLACWAGWHDVGKIGGFQCKDVEAYELLHGYDSLDAGVVSSHGHVTHLFLAHALPALGYDADGDGLALVSPARRVAQMLAGHHGRYPAPPSRRALRSTAIRDRELGAGEWERQRHLHLAAVADVLGGPGVPPVLSVEAAVLATEVVVLSDWLASQEHHVEAQLHAMKSIGGDPLESHWDRALEAAPALIGDAGLLVPQWKETPLA
ncbi:CRISPR-associated endonuclease Cas3'' [Kitasatospora xanthocidica]|uniref:CRISPR-associated endonuclease Cas3 n=1 Tax=Kitasatospora xanthocidica TaxID=83382 RepID=A0A373A1T1_9ACTN|nr:CRISPR-associated endonuclease Cas3'' [Kitasatospora xanthocidica]